MIDAFPLANHWILVW